VPTAASLRFVAATFPATLTADQTFSVQVEVLDQFGQRFPSTDLITLTGEAANPGTLSGSTPTAAVAGLATFANLNVDLVGSYRFTASSSPLTGDTSGPMTVTAGPAARLSVLQSPTVGTAGAVLSPGLEVQCQDVRGNPVAASEAVTVSLAPSPPPGAAQLTGTLTQSAGSDPTKVTFSDLRVDRSGTYRFQLNSTSFAQTTASLSVAAAQAVRTSWVTAPPSSLSSDATATVVVDVVDAHDQRIVDYSDDVQLSLSSDSPAAGAVSEAQTTIGLQGATRSATLTVAASQGRATFTLGIVRTGSFTVEARATGQGLASASQAVTVSAGAASQLTLSGLPAGDTLSRTSLGTLTATLTDGAGNGIPSAGPISLALSGGPGQLSGMTPASTNTTGQANFTGLSVDALGTYQLTPSTSALTGTVSSSFGIFTTVYAGHDTTAGISSFKAGPDGSLTFLERIDTSQRQGGLAVSADGRFVYTSDATSNLVKSWSVQSDGKLQAVGSTASRGTQPAGPLAVSANGSHLYVAHQTGGNVTHVTMTEGAFTSASPIAAPSPTPGTTSGCYLNPAGDKLYVGQKLRMYAVAADGALTNQGNPIASNSFGTPGGQDNSRGMAFRPDGTVAYAIEFNPDVVFAYTVSGGLLTESGVQGLSGFNTMALVLGADSSRLYVSMYTGSLIHTVSLSSDGQTPTLQTTLTLTSGTGPSGLAREKAGRYLYSADRDTGNVSYYTVQADGSLVHSGSVSTQGTSPHALVVR